MNFQGFYIVLVATIVYIISRIIYIKSIEHQKKLPLDTVAITDKNIVLREIRKVYMIAYVLGYGALPVIASHGVSSVLSETFLARGILIPRIIIQLSVISLVFILSIISQKILNIVTILLSLPISLYSLILIIGSLLFNISPDIQSLTGITESVQYNNIHFWQWVALVYFFISSAKMILVFNSNLNTQRGSDKTRSVINIISTSLSIILPILSLIYAYTWLIVDNKSKIAFAEISRFEIVGWSAQSSQLGFTFLLTAVLVAVPVFFLTIPEFIRGEVKQKNIRNIHAELVVQSSNFLRFLLYVVALCYAFLPFNISVSIATVLVLISYSIHYCTTGCLSKILLWRITYFSVAILYTLFAVIMSWGSQSLWIWSTVICLYLLSRHMRGILTVIYNLWKIVSQSIKHYSNNLNRNKDVTLTQLVVTQTIVVFLIISLATVSSWLFPEIFNQKLEFQSWDFLILMMIMLYYITIIIIAFFMIPKINNYEQVKNQLQVTNKHLSDDIQKRKVVEKDLRYTSTHDSLTGSYSRDYIIKKIIHNIQVSSDFNVVFIDIDKFKRINDFYSHSAGDVILKKITQTIKNVFGDNDLVSRYGGDEFLVISKDTSDKFIKKCNTLLQKFNQPIDLEGKRIDIDLSLGVYMYRGQDVGINTILKNIDFALRYAKSQGLEKCIVYTEEIDKLYQQRLLLEEDIKDRLRTGNFSPFYQPIIDVKNKSIVGFEQLLRIKILEKYVLPSQYIPIAEETGQIDNLGWYVLEEACKQIQVFKKSGINQVYISVNVSSNQFVQQDFVQKIKALCKTYKVKPSELRLEITESILLEDSDDVRNIMNELTWNNFLLYLDDFGTGFSNMSYLKKLPIDTLKIDKSFVTQPESANKAVIRAIASLAKELSIRLIAEGVETKAQRDFLNSLGVRVQQGYLYAKPMKPEDTIDFYKNISYT